MSAESHALARHRFDLAKIEADAWAHVIAQDTLAALDDWHKLPTRDMLAKYKAAKAALALASDVLFAAEARGVAS